MAEDITYKYDTSTHTIYYNVQERAMYLNILIVLSGNSKIGSRSHANLACCNGNRLGMVRLFRSLMFCRQLTGGTVG